MCHRGYKEDSDIAESDLGDQSFKLTTICLARDLLLSLVVEDHQLLNVGTGWSGTRGGATIKLLVLEGQLAGGGGESWRYEFLQPQCQHQAALFPELPYPCNTSPSESACFRLNLIDIQQLSRQFLCSQSC